MLLISLLATLPAFAADAPKSSPAKPPTTAPIPMPKAVLSGPQVTGLFQVLKADGSTVIGQANWVRINVSGTCGAEAAPPVTPKPPVEMPSDVALLSRWNSFTSDAAFKAATATVVPGTLGKKQPAQPVKKEAEARFRANARAAGYLISRFGNQVDMAGQ